MKRTRQKYILYCAIPLILMWVPCTGVLAAPEDESVVYEKVTDTSYVAETKSTLPGVYLATGVEGVAVLTGFTDYMIGYEISSLENPYVRVSDFDGVKSNLAQASIDDAAIKLHATVGPAVNMEFGKMTSAGFKLLAADGMPVVVKVGIPKSFAQEDRTFAVVMVRAGGVVTVLEDLDNDPESVTFETTAGQAVYALVKY